MHINTSLFENDFDTAHKERVRAFFSARKKDDFFNEKSLESFVSIIYHYYNAHKRSFAWRDIITPYRVVVSEVMLQQTQTGRVALKFEEFMSMFPDFKLLAAASGHDLIKTWKGLGYNRRALALQKIASIVTERYNGVLPSDPQVLQALPGIGHATARSIAAFAFNSPTVFIETNIRTVFIYFFFKDHLSVSDKELYPLIEKTVDKQNPRNWYYALMDYGVMLKKTVGNISRLSAHYGKQSKFDGSDRQIRGQILHILIQNPGINQHDLIALLNKEVGRVEKILSALIKEGFIKSSNGQVFLR